MKNDLGEAAQVIFHKLLTFNNLYSTLIFFLVPEVNKSSQLIYYQIHMDDIKVADSGLDSLKHTESG